MIWKKATTPFENPYAKAGQVVLDWKDIQTNRTTFDFTKLNTAINTFYTGGKPFVLQLNSPTKPTWIYSQPGIVKVGEHRDARFTWDIPRYWEPLYVILLQEVLVALANYVRSHPKRSVVLGVRATPNLIGNEMFDLRDPEVVITNAAAAADWTFSIAKAKYEEVMRIFLGAFQNGIDNIPTILRSKLFVDFDTSESLREELLGNSKGWLFGTNGTPDADMIRVNNLYYDWVKSGKTKGFYESFRECSYYTHPLSWAYWNQLLELDRGVSYIATYGDDLDRAMSGADKIEYQSAFIFSNLHAGFHNSPNTCPGAFIAFRGTDNNPKGNYTRYITLHNDDGSIGGNTSTVYIDSNQGSSIIGPLNQRFGRYARRTDVGSSKRTFYLRVDDAFLASLAANVTVKVTYLDTGSGSWQLVWKTGSTRTTKTNTNKWITKSFTVPKSGMNNGLAAASDLLLTVSAGSEDTTFHMVEIVR